MEPIRIDGWTRPDPALEEASICFLQEDVSLHSVVVSIVVLRCNRYNVLVWHTFPGPTQVHTWIHHHDIVLIFTMQIANKVSHFVKRELVAKRENLESIHVIDVRPHRFQGNVGFAVVRNHVRDFFYSFVPK